MLPPELNCDGDILTRITQGVGTGTAVSVQRRLGEGRGSGRGPDAIRGHQRRAQVLPSRTQLGFSGGILNVSGEERVSAVFLIYIASYTGDI